MIRALTPKELAQSMIEQEEVMSREASTIEAMIGINLDESKKLLLEIAWMLESSHDTRFFDGDYEEVIENFQKAEDFFNRARQKFDLLRESYEKFFCNEGED